MSTDAPPIASPQSLASREIAGRIVRDRAMAAARAVARPGLLLIVLLAAHLGSRIWLHRTSPLSGTHNYDRTYGVSLSLMAGRGFNDIAVDESAASRPIQEFFDLKRSQISRTEFAAYLASVPDPRRDAYYGRFFSLASIRVADIRLAALLWQVFGIDRGVLAAFYSIFSAAACACVFLIARRLTGSGWAGLAAAALMSLSPIEGFLNTWSWRDVSPMWFTAFAFAWFVCAIVSWQRPAAYFTSYAILGVLAVIGIGWRIDALLLAPFLGGCVLVRLIVTRAGLRRSLAAIACFAAAAIATRSLIGSLGASQTQTENIGFQMAFYSDFPRSKLLGIENSFQVLFSDMQTLDNARQIYRAEHPGGSLAYLSPKYCDVCRRMVYEELSYNLYHWVYGFPAFYWRTLAGLDIQSMIDEVGSKEIQQNLHSPLRQCFRFGDWLDHKMPWLFLFGALSTICAGRQRLSATLLWLFSVYYGGIMFFVLPDQKHLGIFLVPLYVFGGAGVWGIAKLCSRSTWKNVDWPDWVGRARWAARVAISAVAIWGVACVWAHAHSVAKRNELLAEVQSRIAAQGVDAKQALLNERNFTVAIRPDDSGDAAGYLLKISARANPGTLICRQIYYPRDWAHLWGRELITRHKLAPNREQSFFVSCLHGSRLGDPCPHICNIAIDGDAQITRSIRVPMADWNHPQIATLFYDGQNSPGSPAGDSSSTDWLYVGFRPFADQSPDRVLSNRSGMTDIMAPVPPPLSAGRPLEHLIGRSEQTDTWKIAMSDGWRFSFLDVSYWSPAKHWLHLKLGDFNGDGLTDIIGQVADGHWWLATANGGYHTFRAIDELPRDERFDFVGVGDFNGDCLDDLVLRTADGHWQLALSDGKTFHCRPIDGLPAGVASENILIGDFLGNGRSQIAVLESRSGQWTIAGLDGNAWHARPWGKLAAGVKWQHLIAAEFRGTGHADVAAWDPASGEWTVGGQQGNKFVAMPFGKWSPTGAWKCVQAGQFGDRSHVGLAALDAKTGKLAVAVSDGQKFTTREYPGHDGFSKEFFVGTFSGGPRDELLGIGADGQLWVGQFGADGQLSFRSWGRWPNVGQFTDFCSLGCWPEREPRH